MVGLVGVGLVGCLVLLLVCRVWCWLVSLVCLFGGWFGLYSLLV